MGTDVFFTADDGVHGRELWKTDGTTAGTVLVADLCPGGAGGISSDGNNLAGLGGKVFFQGNDGAGGYGLWASDGTAAGTVLIKAISGPDPSLPVESIVRSGAGLIFTAAGDQIWKSDGTGAGTVLVKTITPGGFFTGWKELTPVGSLVFFTDSERLWRTDGTAAGTFLLAAPQNPGCLTATGSFLMFCADDGIWRSDGSVSGTLLLKNLVPSFTLAVLNGVLFFPGSTAEHGTELWKSDGTAAGNGPGQGHPARDGPE